MRSALHVTLAVLLGAAAIATMDPPALAGPPAGDWAKLNGTWEVSAYIGSGKSFELKGDLLNRRDVFKDGQYTILSTDKVITVMAVKLDSTKSPAEIDVERTSGSGKGLKQKGIYKLEGDVLTLCLSARERPTEFESAPGSKRFLFVLKRVGK